MPAPVIQTTTLGETLVVTETIGTTKTIVSEASVVSATKRVVKRDAVALPSPSIVSQYCTSDTGRRFLSACSCIVAELTTGVTLPAVTPRTVTVTNTITRHITTSLPTPTSTLIITPKSTKTVTDVTEVTPSANKNAAKSFKMKFKGGMHDGRYLFKGPIFEEQAGIYYSMFTPNRADGIDFKISKDGVISTLIGDEGYNLTYSRDFDDDALYPPEKEGDPPIKVPSFVFLMSESTQAKPEYNAYPIKCSMAGNDFSCVAGFDNKRTESGWYAFGIDAENYIPTLGLGKPAYDWMYWPGQKVTLVADWNA
ncbi:hypothetical protein TWF730_001692 [Orbilia blumenaviensis]|uniref:Uncharacterized protein n=1 Tax=Orbilia blumenaviensis TaxID=1796055 RepID=A0AAV9ULJ7_9PEZI